jgi:hypothetical protein
MIKPGVLYALSNPFPLPIMLVFLKLLFSQGWSSWAPITHVRVPDSIASHCVYPRAYTKSNRLRGGAEIISIKGCDVYSLRPHGRSKDNVQVPGENNKLHKQKRDFEVLRYLRSQGALIRHSVRLL